jgi:acyl-coenzyme A synthetase/AMP-(fatty) acid ligase
MNTATRFIDDHVQANLGHKRAFDFGTKPYSYYDLAALANRAGNLLKACGAAKGSTVLLLLPESPAYLGSLIGAIKIGAAALLPDKADDPACVAACMAANTPQLAIVHASFLEKLAPALAALGEQKVIVVGEASVGHPSFVGLMRAQSSSLAAEPMAPEAPGLILGAAKPVSLSHKELEQAVQGQGAAGLGRVMELLRALAHAETARLS